MEKIIQYNLNVACNQKLPCILPMHDYAVGGIEFKNGKISFFTEDFEEHDYDYSDFAGFAPKRLFIEFCDLCDDVFFADVTRFYTKKQVKEKHKDNDCYGSRSNRYSLSRFINFYAAYNLQFDYTAVSHNQAILFFRCNNPKNKMKEASVKIQCKTIIYRFEN